MDFLTFTWVDYTLFVLMFGFSGAIGIYFGLFRKQHTTSDYLLGGKKMKVFPVSMSLVASTLSGISLLGFPAEIYIHGTQYAMMTVSLIIVGIINNLIYLPVFYKLQLTNAFEYFQLRFDKRVTTMVSIVYTLTVFLWLPIFIYAPTLAFNQVTGFDFHIVGPIMSLICVFYTTIGGLKAVVWADTLQFSITLCTLSFVLVMGIISVGGVALIWERSSLGNRLEFFNMNPDPTVRNTFWSVVIGNLAFWSSLFATEPAAIQRSIAVPSLGDARKCLIIYITVTFVTKLMSSFYGLIMYAKYYDCDPLSAGYIKRADQIMPYHVLDIATNIPGLSGLFVAGLFTTALSALSTFLNALSGIFYYNFIAPFMPSSTSEKKASTIMKIITVALGFLNTGLIFVMERMGTLLEIALNVKGLTSGPILGLVTMGMFFPFANTKGAFCGGTGAILLMLFIVIKAQIHIWNGTIRYALKPLHIYGCNATTPTQSNLINETYTPTTRERHTSHPSEEPFWLFRISLHYYTLLGCLIVLIIGLPISWITRNKTESSVHPDLLAPFLRRCRTSRYASIERELHSLEKGKENAKYKESVCEKLLE